MTRQEAYKLTQGVAMKCYEGKLDFVEELKNDEAVRSYLSMADIDGLTDNRHYFRFVDRIFDRVFGETQPVKS